MEIQEDHLTGSDKAIDYACRRLLSVIENVQTRDKTQGLYKEMKTWSMSQFQEALKRVIIETVKEMNETGEQRKS